MVGTHGHAPVGAANGDAAPLLTHEYFHYCRHVKVTVEMARLIKAAGVADIPRIAQVQEVDAVGEAAGHGDHVVLRTARERTGAEGDAVVERRIGLLEPLHVVIAAHDAGHAEYGVGRIVRMDGQIDTVFLADRNQRVDEILEVGAILLLVDVFITGDVVQENFLVVAGRAVYGSVDEALGGYYYIIAESLGLLGGHCGEHLLGFGEVFIAVVVLGAGPFQDEDVESDESGIVEAEPDASSDVRIVQNSAAPVQNRHEIIADSIDTAFAEVLYRLAIVFDMLVTPAASSLDIF